MPERIERFLLDLSRWGRRARLSRRRCRRLIGSMRETGKASRGAECQSESEERLLHDILLKNKNRASTRALWLSARDARRPVIRQAMVIAKPPKFAEPLCGNAERLLDLRHIAD
jgi:hypothetical protein